MSTAERFFDPRDAFLGGYDGALGLVDLVVVFVLQTPHDACELVVELGRVGGPARDDERRARLVDEDRVDLVDDRVEVRLDQLGSMAALHLLFAADDHVVAQVVEAELVVRAVGDVAVVLRALLVGRGVVGDDHADLQAEEAVQPAHPLRVEAGEVVVDGDEVHAAARERVQVARQRRDEGLALAGLHLRDPTEVQRRAAHHLDVEVALAEHPLARLADRRERLREQVVEHVVDSSSSWSASLRAGLGPVDSTLELGSSGYQLLVAQLLHLGFERGDERDDRLDGLEPLALTGVEKLLEDAHAGYECTGGVGGAPVAGLARRLRPGL